MPTAHQHRGGGRWHQSECSGGLRQASDQESDRYHRLFVVVEEAVMSRVYVVASGEYEQYHIVAVFTTEALADAYIEEHEWCYMDGTVDLDPKS